MGESKDCNKDCSQPHTEYCSQNRQRFLLFSHIISLRSLRMIICKRPAPPVDQKNNNNNSNNKKNSSSNNNSSNNNNKNDNELHCATRLCKNNWREDVVVSEKCKGGGGPNSRSKRQSQHDQPTNWQITNTNTDYGKCLWMRTNTGTSVSL